MAAAAAELRRRSRPRPPAPPRPVITGQVPVARTRAVPVGPTGTAQLPVVRQPAPTAAPQDPARRRLRTPPVELDRDATPQARPHAAPTAPRMAAPVATPGPRPLPPIEPAAVRRPVATAPTPAPAPALRRSTRPAPRLAPPPPVVQDVRPAPRRRRPGRGLLAMLCVAGLFGVVGLPAVASEADDEPPVAGVQEGDELQQFQVGTGFAGSGTTTDLMAGEMPVSTPTWVVPVHGDLRDGFGPRLAQPVPGVSLFHRGQDIGGGCGAAIHAAADGVVETATYWGTYGNWVLIDHGNGVETGYAQQERYIVHPGQRVRAGQVIGYEGRTGAATGCHLHLEVHLNGVAVNPIPFFIARGVPLGS